LVEGLPQKRSKAKRFCAPISRETSCLVKLPKTSAFLLHQLLTLLPGRGRLGHRPFKAGADYSGSRRELVEVVRSPRCRARARRRREG